MKTVLLVVTVALLLATVSARGLRGDQGLIDSIERALIMEAFNDEVARIAMDRKQNSFGSGSNKPKLSSNQEWLINNNRKLLLKGEEPWYIARKDSKFPILIFFPLYSVSKIENTLACMYK